MNLGIWLYVLFKDILISPDLEQLGDDLYFI